MGLFSFLFAGPEPKKQAPKMPLRRFFHWEDIPPNGNYTVIDTETSGLDACIHEILEIGAIKYRNNQETERFHTYVRPEGKIQKSASDVNHLTWAKVCGAPSFHEIIPAFLSFIGKDTLVGYNIEFDIKFIQTRSGRDIENPAFDVLPMVQAAVPLDRYRLDDVRRHFNLSGTAHTAIGDCITTACIFQKCFALPGSQQLIQERVRFAEQQREIMQAERNRIDAVLAKKNIQKEGMPSSKELRKISSQMKGRPFDYFCEVKKIVIEAGLPWKDIHESKIRTSSGSTVLCIKVPWIQFFGVKETGNLKYIILDLPPESIKCDYVCGPSSLQEGEERCRIFIPSPESLHSITEYILASYKHASSIADETTESYSWPYEPHNWS